MNDSGQIYFNTVSIYVNIFNCRMFKTHREVRQVKFKFLNYINHNQSDSIVSKPIFSK